MSNPGITRLGQAFPTRGLRLADREKNPGLIAKNIIQNNEVANSCFGRLPDRCLLKVVTIYGMTHDHGFASASTAGGIVLIKIPMQYVVVDLNIV